MRLKPCPFCGCTDARKVDDGHSEWIECNWCGATSGHDEACPDQTPEQAWNTRQPVTTQEAAGIGLLRKALEKGEIDRVLTGLSIAVSHEILRGETAERIEMARDDYEAMATLVDAARIVAAPDEGVE